MVLRIYVRHFMRRKMKPDGKCNTYFFGIGFVHICVCVCVCPWRVRLGWSGCRMGIGMGMGNWEAGFQITRARVK